MISTVARIELIRLIRDGRLRALCIVFTLLGVLAGIRGYQGFRERSGEIREAEKAEESSWLSQGEKDPHSAAHDGQFAFRPVTSLAILDSGLDDYLGSWTLLEAHKQNPFTARAAADGTVAQRMARTSLADILTIIGPLVVILLVLGVFGGDVERRRARLLVTQGVSLRTLVLGGVAAVFVAVGVAIAPALIASGIFILSEPPDPSWSPWPRLLLFGVTHSVHLLAVGFLAASVTLRFRSGWTARTFMLLGWVFLYLIAPRALAIHAEHTYSPPSSTAFWRQHQEDMKSGVDGHDAGDKRGKKLLEETLQKYNVKRVEDLPVNYAGIALQAGEEHANSAFDLRWGEIWNGYRDQRKLMDGFGAVVPLLSVRSLSSGFAGTDLIHHEDFARGAELHRRNLNRGLNDDLAKNGVRNREYKAGKALWTALPTWDPAPVGLSRVGGEYVLASACLGAFFLASFCLFLFATSRRSQHL